MAPTLAEAFVMNPHAVLQIPYAVCTFAGSEPPGQITKAKHKAGSKASAYS
jgi:hypothetical protein